MIYLEPPKDFDPKLEAVACFCEYDGKFVLLRRAPHIPHGNTWGFPAGGVEKGEDLVQAIRREMSEELGLEVPESQVRHIGTLFARFPEHDYQFHVYKTQFSNEPNIKLNEEHEEFVWVSPVDALDLELHPGNDQIIRIYYGKAFVD